MTLDYGYVTTIQADDLEQALARVTAALKEEGFGILTEIDVRATLRKKLDVDFRPYRILGACNPPLAHQALRAEPWIGLLLPCNVVVQQREDGAFEVGAIDPGTMVTLTDNPEIESVANEVDCKLRRVLESLG